MMQINLTFPDLVLLASRSKVEKDGVTIVIERPVLPQVSLNLGDAAENSVIFNLDDSDPRSTSIVQEMRKSHPRT